MGIVKDRILTSKEKLIDKEWITKAGLRAIAVKMYQTYYCGYVFVDKNHPAFKMDYDDKEIEAIKMELEITDSRREREHLHLRRFGFYTDYVFYTDEEKLDIDFCIRECERLALGLQKIDKKLKYQERCKRRKANGK